MIRPDTVEKAIPCIGDVSAPISSLCLSPQRVPSSIDEYVGIHLFLTASNRPSKSVIRGGEKVVDAFDPSFLADSADVVDAFPFDDLTDAKSSDLIGTIGTVDAKEDQ